jgi:hypothetical protein
MPATHTVQYEFDIGDIALLPVGQLSEDIGIDNGGHVKRKTSQRAARVAWTEISQYSRNLPDVSSGEGLSFPHDFLRALYESAAIDVGAEQEPESARVSYRDPNKVVAYLKRHPEVVSFMSRAWPALIRTFGTPVDVALEVISYPEAHAHDELVGWIQSTDDVYEGLDKLERFESEWFLDHLPEIGNKFNFNIETK